MVSYFETTIKKYGADQNLGGQLNKITAAIQD
jgi:hypothetical protein